jgi:hypothetical protein
MSSGKTLKRSRYPDETKPKRSGLVKPAAELRIHRFAKIWVEALFYYPVIHFS